MTQELTKLFDDEMEIIREDEPFLPLGEQLKLAEERLVEKITRQVARIAEQRRWRHEEETNKMHFPG